jgi:hypothetical protein
VVNGGGIFLLFSYFFRIKIFALKTGQKSIQGVSRIFPDEI